MWISSIICSFLQDIHEYEKFNEPLRQMIASYRVPSINNYVNLKSKQIHLHRQRHTWERKVQIAERELHLRQTEVNHHPEKIIHPWKYLQNPSPILYYRQYKSSSKTIDEKRQLNENKAMFSIIMWLTRSGGNGRSFLANRLFDFPLWMQQNCLNSREEDYLNNWSWSSLSREI